MDDWVVESPSFIEDLMNDRMINLNKNGINEVVKIIKEKDKEIERLHNIIKEVRELLNKSNISVIEYTGHEDYEYDYITDKVIEILDKENK